MDTGIEQVDDAELAKIAQYGYNGIWIHQPLRDYTPSEVFPEFGRESSRYLRLLEELSERAARHGIRVYMYLLEPRAMVEDDPFWKTYPELRGQRFFQPGFNLNYYALCSSQPRVREYLYDSLQKLCSQIDMSFFAITAAEDFNTCIGKLVSAKQAKEIHCTTASKITSGINCPLCSERTGAEIISELLNTMHAGITAGNPDAELIAWDWGWRKLPWPDTEKNILDSIHKDIIFISDFEIGGKRHYPREQSIYEYSLGYAGPSESFADLVSCAHRQGRRTGAKLQVGTTHELASVPNLPLIHNLWEKIDGAQRLGVSAVLATWNLGTFQTLNTYLFGHAMTSEESVAWADFLKMACDYLSVPLDFSIKLENAWNCFEHAMQHFPFCVPMLYQGPINYAPAYWLPPRQTRKTPMGMSCYMLEHGDDLDYCCGDYSLDEVIELYGKLVENWGEGFAYLKDLRQALPEVSARFMEEYNNAACIGRVYRSTMHIFKVFRLCRAWNDSMRYEYLEICQDELDNCRKLLPYLRADRRLGMHLECKGYMFSPELVEKKIKSLESITANLQAYCECTLDMH